jgi:hypothetical protein
MARRRHYYRLDLLQEAVVGTKVLCWAGIITHLWKMTLNAHQTQKNWQAVGGMLWDATPKKSVAVIGL